MVSFPPCKINLGLHVLAKRTDGYHDIETCFFPVPWTDVLEIIPSTEFQFSSTGIVIPGKEQENLCIRAYKLLQDAHALPPVKIHLHKIIPMGAGLGGGSADGAHTLRLLDSIFELKLSTGRLCEYAAQLGSDCSFFIGDEPMLGTGRGEILTPIKVNLCGYQLVLVKPNVHVSTKDAYAGLTPKAPAEQIRKILNRPVSDWKHALANDFEPSVFRKFPEIEKIKNRLYELGAVYACMSGSGATVFALFEKPISLHHEFAGCDYWQGFL
ncbi:MAG: 4-(cytidine 5'-diphospho)-2-C-methyl-D-erythritol kinase [Flammeovirgaceae bacterium]